MQSYKVKVNADLDSLLGKPLASAVKSLREVTWKRLPASVAVSAEKPSFYLNDGDTLTAYSIDLSTMAIQGKRYCGSADTAIHHPEQFGVGFTPPANAALMFVRTYWNGRNTSWELHIVTKNLQPLLQK